MTKPGLRFQACGSETALAKRANDFVFMGGSGFISEVFQ
jgi:hypothetical protein